MTAIAVICKEPVPGRVKTRLCPPLSPAAAARLAAAALCDTFAAVRATPCARRVAVLDGVPGPWLGPAIDVVEQRGAGLDERLANAFADLAEPTLLIGMDTPQVTPAGLAAALVAMTESGSVLGMALDGGYWAIGLGAPDGAALVGVPMSTPRTGRLQHDRMLARGWRPALLETLVDVDDIASARAVAALAPEGQFAAALGAVDPVGVAA